MVRIASKLTFTDLTGGLNNVDSIDNINATNKNTETPDIMNVEYFKLGGIRTMKGNTVIGDKQDLPIIGGWEYTKDDTRYMIIALNDGTIKILNKTTETFDEIYKFASSSDRVSFCNMNNGVVITNGKDDLVFYEYGRHQILTGVVTITENSIDVVGTDTKFETELKSGDRIDIDNNVYIVDTITDDTHLSLREEALSTGSNLNYYLDTISECNATLVNEEDPNVNTPIRGLAIQYYNGRLWVGTDNGLFYSQVGQYNKWDIKYDAGVINSIYNDTSKINALGLYADMMLIHKKFNTYALTCSGDSSTIQVKTYSNITCDSQQSWIVSNTKYFVYSKSHMDIYPLVQRTIFSDKYLGDTITKKVRNIFTNIRENDTNKIFCVTYPKNRWMIFYLPMIDQLGSGYGLIYDFQTKSFLVRRLPQDQEVTIAFSYNNNVYIGTRYGLVLKEFSGRTFKQWDSIKNEIVDSPIVAYYKSPWFDWTNGYIQSFAEFALEIANDENNDFYIRTFKDGSSPFEDRLITNDLLTGASLIWDGIEDLEQDDNDTTWDNDDWVSGTFESIRMLLPNNVFKKFQLEIGTNALNQSFAIYGYQFRRIETDEAPW